MSSATDSNKPPKLTAPDFKGTQLPADAAERFNSLRTGASPGPAAKPAPKPKQGGDARSALAAILADIPDDDENRRSFTTRLRQDLHSRLYMYVQTNDMLKSKDHPRKIQAALDEAIEMYLAAKAAA